MQHLRGRIAKSDVPPRTYVPRTYVRTYVPTCLGTSVPRQKLDECRTLWGEPERVQLSNVHGAVA